MMTKIQRSILFSVCVSGLLVSCNPIYKCGEARPDNFAAGNRLMAVVNERDELCDLSKLNEKTIAQLTTEKDSLKLEMDTLRTNIGSLTNQLSDLNTKYSNTQDELALQKDKNFQLAKQYNAAVTENLNQGHLYDERIKDKERRLAEKQQEVDAKESELARREKQIQDLQSELKRRDSLMNQLNSMLEGALLGFSPDELTIERKDGKIYVSMSDKLMFQSGKADVQEKGKEALKKLAAVLSKNDSFEILVEGHTDNVPIKTAKYQDNWDLSSARALSVVRILLSDGVLNPGKLTAAGKGEFEPKASNDTPEGRAKNRRTEIILSPNLSEIMNYLERK